MNINLDELKQKTEEAIQSGKKEAALSELEKTVAKLAKDNMIRTAAEAIISRIPEHCQAAAAKGKNKALIMKERNYTHWKATFNNGWTAIITGGPGILVIDACKKAGLLVNVGYNHDGAGIESWAEIYVSW